MTRIVHNIGMALLVVGGASFVAFGIAIRVMNPDMTEMRLLLTYWPQILTLLCVLIAGFVFCEYRR